MAAWILIRILKGLERLKNEGKNADITLRVELGS
jgi:hypothetical protein